MSNLSDFIGGGGGLILRRQLFTASGTWTKSVDLVGDQVFITAIGGGGSGNSATSELGGCSGAYIIRLPVNVSDTSSETITIGVGGNSVGGEGSNTGGEPGGASSFGSLVSVVGAVGSGSSVARYLTRLTGQNPGCSSSNFLACIPGIFGAAIAESVGESISLGLGGSGLLLDTSGTRGGAVAYDSAPGGNGYGAGGAAGTNTFASGAGADGAVLVEWLEKV